MKETFNELFEINVIDIDAFMRWKDRAKNETNYPIILAATRWVIHFESLKIQMNLFFNFYILSGVFMKHSRQKKK